MNAVSTIRCALFICATLVPSNQALDEFTFNYLQSKGISVKKCIISETIEKHNTGAKLYGLYRDNITRIQKTSFIQEIYRFLWFYNVIVDEYERLTPAKLLSIVNAKFEEEKAFDEDIDRHKFGCFKSVDREFASTEAIVASGKVLAQFKKDFSQALTQLNGTFNELRDYSYMNDLFGYVEKDDTVGVNTKKQTVADNQFATTVQSPEVLGKHAEYEESNTEATFDCSQDNGLQFKYEMQLRDQIRVLKNDKRDLEIKLAYAKKDAIREFLGSLTGYGWNCPLSELYRLEKEPETPGRIKGVINNLFMALGSENIRITREKVGERIILNETSQKSFDPYKNEAIFLGDEAEIYYPGYRYEHEIMIRPIVRKKEKEKENMLDENG